MVIHWILCWILSAHLLSAMTMILATFGDDILSWLSCYLLAFWLGLFSTHMLTECLVSILVLTHVGGSWLSLVLLEVQSWRCLVMVCIQIIQISTWVGESSVDSAVWKYITSSSILWKWWLSLSLGAMLGLCFGVTWVIILYHYLYVLLFSLDYSHFCAPASKSIFSLVFELGGTSVCSFF